MYKWYVTRGYPLQFLLESTYAERVLLREGYEEWSRMWEEAEKETRGLKHGG